jgi:hypothetical protein
VSRTRLPQPGPVFCILMTISPTSRVKDIEAFLDSYAVVLSLDMKILLSLPAWHIEHRIRWPEAALHVEVPNFGKSRTRRLPGIPTLSLSLFIHPSPAQEGRTYSRWPFFVESELSAVFSAGGQWWRFDFVPGQHYNDRLAQPEVSAPNKESS